MIDLGEAAASPVDRRLALIGGAVMLLPALVAAPALGSVTGASYPLFAIVVSLAIAMMMMSAVLLAAQAHVARSRPLLVLAAAYAATGLVMLPYLLFYRGLWPELVVAASAAPQSSAWLWLEWHLLFAASPAIYVAGRRWSAAVDAGTFRRFELRLWVLSFVVVALIVSPAIWIASPLVFSVHGAWTPLATGSSLTVIVVALLSIVALFVQNRFRSILDLWLAVAALLLIADVAVSRFGGGLFTIGWYVSRGYVLVASGTLLTALILQTANVYAQLARTTDRLRDESLTDVLTGLANRRRFDAHFAQVLADGARSSRAVALLMIDVDNFKAYNDAFGHPAGDVCLRSVADSARASVPRASDLVARFGGEEIVVVLAETELAGAAIVAERIRSAVERLCIPHAPNATHDVVTVSIGFAAVDDATGMLGSTLLADADRALYLAKRAGRNRASSAYAVVKAS